MTKTISLTSAFENSYIAEATPQFEYKFKGSEKEKAHMDYLFERLWESDSAKELILSAINDGYEFEFCSSMSSRGVSSGQNKYLLLNPTEKDDRLVATLAHELRHCQQFKNGIVKDIKGNNIRTEILQTRAIEADAFAYSILVAHELKNSQHRDIYGNKGDSKPWEELTDTDKVLTSCFERSFNNDGDTTKALYETFKAWYHHKPIVEQYDKILCNKLGIVEQQASFASSATFSRDEHISSIVKKTCNHKGASYFADSPLMLLSRDYYSVSEETSKTIKDFFAKRAEQKLSVDDSHHLIHVKKENTSNDNDSDNIMQFAARKVLSRS